MNVKGKWVFKQGMPYCIAIICIIFHYLIFLNISCQKLNFVNTVKV